MAISKEQADKIRAAYQEFVDLLGDRYVNSQLNVDIIKKLMIENNVGSEYWISTGAWIEFHARASKAGMLEEPAAPKTKAELDEEAREREYALHQKDRFSGSKRGNQPGTEDPRALEAKRREAQETKERSERLAAQEKAVELKQVADNDLSVVPTVAQIVAGEAALVTDLTGAAVAKYSQLQLKRYFANSKAAQTQIQADRYAVRIQKQKEWEQQNA